MAITFRFTYPIERTMEFEQEYHPNLRLTLPEKRELLNPERMQELFDVPVGVEEEGGYYTLWLA